MLRNIFVKLFKFCIILLLPIVLHSQTITTIAGNGTGGFYGDGGVATNAELYVPGQLIVDENGNIYLTDASNNRIRKINNSTGFISTVAGNGTAGYNGDNIAATNATLDHPSGIALDKSGNIFVTDFFNNRVRKITTSGVISTIAGNGGVGFSGDNVQATSATIGDPLGIDLDTSGNIYFTDGNQRVRKVSTSGIITTVAGNGSAGYGGDGGQATLTMLHNPHGIHVDCEGNIYIADMDNRRVRKVSPTGEISTIAGDGLSGYSGDGFNATSARIYPTDIVKDKFGNIFVSDFGSSTIRRISVDNIITTIVGNGIMGYNGDNISATNCKLYQPFGVALDTCENIYIADSYNHRIRKVTYPSCNYLTVPDIVQTAISIFPTPVKDILHITGIKEATAYTLCEMTGRAVMAGALLPKENEINISNLAMGMYLLQVQYRDGQREIRKIVKE